VKFAKGHEPDLLWSREHKLLVAYPQRAIATRQSNKGTAIPSDLSREFVRWSQNQPRNAVQFTVPLSAEH